MKRALSLAAGASVLALALAAHAFPESGHPAMLDPQKAQEKAPATFRAKLETTKGNVVFECTRDWAPNGVDRFYNLVKIGYFDDVAFFRVVKGFVVQWGIHGNPKVSAVWSDANLPPDPPKQSNKRGTLTYAMAGSPDTRSTQLFVNYKDNTNLDAMGFAPICQVVEGMDVIDKLNGQYGEEVTNKQGSIQAEGNAYLRSKYPELDYIKTSLVVGEAPSPERGQKLEGGDAHASDSGDKIVFGAIAVIVLGGGAFVIFGSKSGGDTPAPKPAEKPAAPAAEAPKKKKKKKSPDAEPKAEGDDGADTKAAEPKSDDDEKADDGE